MLSERVIGKKAWVTGAAHGIGRASAWALAEAGADVAISDINEKGLEETAEYIRKLGRKALVLPADITKENEIEETINTIVDKWGKLDIAYCNAGTFQDIPAEDMPLEEFERVIKVNLTGVNNPVPVSLLSGDRKPQIRFLGNHHSGSGNLYHKSFRM